MPVTPSVPPTKLVEFADVLLDLAHELDFRQPELRGLVPLTGTEIAVVREVHRTPRATPSQIAESSGLQRSNVSTALRTLEAKGLVPREQAPGNARSVVLVPTEQAGADVARIHAWWESRLGGVDPRAIDRVVDALDALREVAAGLRSR